MNRMLVVGVVLAMLSLPAKSAPPETATQVIVLGVDHAAQLVAREDRPAVLAAFLDRAAPDAICIERSPEAFARNDFYEFTYEVQDVVVPFARERNIDVCPFDWHPSTEDAQLGFGMDLEAIPEIRPIRGFQQFLTFPEPAQLHRTLFHADDPHNVTRSTQWSLTPAARTAQDLPRRLFLYRTFLQAKRIAAAARAHPGGTVVVVVGEFHKRDIDAVLADEPGIVVVQPSSLGAPNDADVHQRELPAYRFAVASFNLLGRQAETGNRDDAFLRETVDALSGSGAAAEVQLLATRLDLLQGRISRAEAIGRYRQIAATAGEARFTWTGVKDIRRLDSWFDPFGNLSVRQRAHLELARESIRAGRRAEADRLRTALGGELTARQRRQLDGYWPLLAK